MKIKINQLDEEVNEKNVKMQQFKTEVDQLHHQLVGRHQEPTSTNKISVGSQTKKVGINIMWISYEKKVLPSYKFIQLLKTWCLVFYEI